MKNVNFDTAQLIIMQELCTRQVLHFVDFVLFVGGIRAFSAGAKSSAVITNLNHLAVSSEKLVHGRRC